MSQRHAVVKKLAISYRDAGRKEKSRILNEVVELTGYHRNHARAALAGALQPSRERKVADRRPLYSHQVVVALTRCWAETRYPTGKRLVGILPVLVPLLVAEGELVLSEHETTQLLAMSAATIDRRLAPERVLRQIPGLRGHSHTKPGTLLKSQIPIKTWMDWDDTTPGFVEVDLVGHEGGDPSGEFCFTLTMTDVCTGWTVNRSVKNKAARWVTDAIDYARRRFPFPVLGIDSDNGSEFINFHLLEYCQAEKVTFTRARTANSNDAAHVEQKNWTRVRELVGYLRLDTEEEVELLNEIWELDCLFSNHLLAQQKLVFKERAGAKVTKRYDAAATPLQRTIASGVLSPARKGALTRATNQIKPVALAGEIRTLVKELQELALCKGPRTPTRAVNRSFNPPRNPKILR